MAEVPLTREDVQLFAEDLSNEQADAMIATVWSKARKLAPCLKDTEVDALADDDEKETVRSILRAIILRWADTGSGGVTSQGAGDFTESLSEFSGGRWRPDEIAELQAICADTYQGQKATTIPTGYLGPLETQHAAWCSINFGDTVCDCGADISADGYPLWKNRPIPENP